MGAFVITALYCWVICICGAEVFDEDAAYRWIFEDWSRAVARIDGVTALFKGQPNNGEFVQACIQNSADRDEIRFYANATFTPDGGRQCMEFYQQSYRNSVNQLLQTVNAPITVNGIEATAFAAIQRGFTELLKNAPFAALDPNPGQYKKITADFLLIYEEWKRIAETSDAGPKCLELDTSVNGILLVQESFFGEDTCPTSPQYR